MEKSANISKNRLTLPMDLKVNTRLKGFVDFTNDACAVEVVCLKAFEGGRAW